MRINYDINIENIFNELMKANEGMAIIKYLDKRNLIPSYFLNFECIESSEIEGVDASNDYTNRYHKAIELGKNQRITIALIKKLHNILFNSNGFRDSNCYIGSKNHIAYIPPSIDEIDYLMEDLIAYINNGNDKYPLVKASIIHLAFETIHPFSDGNGRFGRLLVLLYLINTGTISNPNLCLSYILNKNKGLYYEALNKGREDFNSLRFVKFFLKAISDTATFMIDVMDNLKKLHDETTSLIKGLKEEEKLTKLLIYLEDNPILDITSASKALGYSYNTASKLIGILESINVLESCENKSRNRHYKYKKYLAIFTTKF